MNKTEELKLTEKKRQIIDQMIEASHPMTEEGWRKVAKLGIDNDINIFDMSLFVDEEEPWTSEDWIGRAEMFETMLHLMNAMYSVTKEAANLPKEKEK